MLLINLCAWNMNAASRTPSQIFGAYRTAEDDNLWRFFPFRCFFFSTFNLQFAVRRRFNGEWWIMTTKPNEINSSRLTTMKIVGHSQWQRCSCLSSHSCELRKHQHTTMHVVNEQQKKWNNINRTHTCDTCVYLCRTKMCEFIATPIPMPTTIWLECSVSSRCEYVCVNQHTHQR